MACGESNGDVTEIEGGGLAEVCAIWVHFLVSAVSCEPCSLK